MKGLAAGGGGRGASNGAGVNRFIVGVAVGDVVLARHRLLLIVPTNQPSLEDCENSVPIIVVIIHPG